MQKPLVIQECYGRTDEGTDGPTRQGVESRVRDKKKKVFSTAIFFYCSRFCNLLCLSITLSALPASDHLSVPLFTHPSVCPPFRSSPSPFIVVLFLSLLPSKSQRIFDAFTYFSYHRIFFCFFLSPFLFLFSWFVVCLFHFPICFLFVCLFTFLKTCDILFFFLSVSPLFSSSLSFSVSVF